MVKKGHGYDIDSISDEATAFAKKLLSAKLLWNICHNQVATPFVYLGSQCAKGVFYNSETYLLNEFVEDCREAQDPGHMFHYSWLLNLVAVEAWRVPTRA